MSLLQQNQQASHIGLSWTARHDPTMPRQCGYCTERTQANTHGRRKQHQAPVLVLRRHQNPKEMPTIVKEHALDHVSCPFWTRKRQMDQETANARPQDAQSDAYRRFLGFGSAGGRGGIIKAP